MLIRINGAGVPKPKDDHQCVHEYNQRDNNQDKSQDFPLEVG